MSVEFKSRILQTNKKRAVGKYDAALWQEGLLAFSLFASHVALSSNVWQFAWPRTQFSATNLLHGSAQEVLYHACIV